MEQAIHSQKARSAAAVIATVAFVALAVRLYLLAEQSASVLAAASLLAQFFTILTNTLTMVMMAWIALGRDLSPRLIKAIVISIVCVGLIYHTLLSHLVSLTGVELWADHGTHTFVPALTALWWILLAPKPRLRPGDIALWIMWPAIYCVYILIRASFSGFYPYPFLNVPEIGWDGLAVNVVGQMLVFIAVGLVLTGLGAVARRLSP